MQIWTNGGNIYEEKYLIKYAGDGWYKIFEKTSGLIMEVVDIIVNDNLKYLIIVKFKRA